MGTGDQSLMPCAHFMHTDKGLGLMSASSKDNANKFLGGWDAPASHAWWNEYKGQRELVLLPAILQYSKAKRANPKLPN